jgi:hypothetical protein
VEKRGRVKGGKMGGLRMGKRWKGYWLEKGEGLRVGKGEWLEVGNVGKG